MKSRIPIIVLLIIALCATGVTRQFAAAKRDVNRTLGAEAVTDSNSKPTFGNMKPFALALLLGGLRGPLVMILWSSSESQKGEKNLEDFDTKVEWIRMLQPEFDSVHIFQIWNKAYNISVQMASLSNKYLAIIDAIAYAQDVNVERPDNINIIYALGGVYGDKLGDAAEKVYYARRVREESKPHTSRQKLPKSDPGYRRLQLDPVLDDQGRILPEYLKPTNVRLTDPTSSDVYDGSELPFLKQFEPYPYGIEPHGFGYNYRKRAQLLARLGNQKHAQLSESVVDSRPAIDLKIWGEAEWGHARRLELRALGKPIPTEPMEMETADEELPANLNFSDAAKAQLREAIFSYNLAQRLWKVADAEYVAHMRHYKTNIGTYESHRDEIIANGALLKGDEEYLLALLAPANERTAHLAAARTAYQRAIVRYGLIILRFYVTGESLAPHLPAGVTPQNFATTWMTHSDDLTPAQVMSAVNGATHDMQTKQQMQIPDEVTQYLTYIERADVRSKHTPS